MADKIYVSLGDCVVKASFDAKYKSSMRPVMGEALKKGIEASGDFTTTNPHPGDKDAKSFSVNVSISITKDDKSKPPKLKVLVEYTGLFTGTGTSGQQFKGSANALTTATSKVDEDVKALVKDALADLTDKNGKMFKAMRDFLKQ
jgi:hypothetical protein